LIDLVVERFGLNKKMPSRLREALLVILGKAVVVARELSRQQFGKVKVCREQLMGNGRVLVTKVRQSMGSEGSDSADNDSDDAADMPEAAESAIPIQMN
jgi:hypothetical protein